MKDKVYAAVDIGSNAARLLIKKAVFSDEKLLELKKLLLLRVPLRLGFDVFAKGKVGSKRAENLLRLMKVYRQLMKIYGVDEYRACATSAMRDAENGPQLIKEVKEATGIRLELIAGEEEAQIVYANHMECMVDRKGCYLYVDVGGGSTETNFIEDGRLLDSKSFNIGTVRILSGKVRPGEWSDLKAAMRRLAERHDHIDIIGSGGNINKIYKMAASRNEEESSISVDELRAIYNMLAPLSVGERMERYNLKEDRADVIVPAAEIFLTIAEIIRAEKIIVPVIGVADGLIDSLIAADTGQNP